jgi:hypothetical protein
MLKILIKILIIFFVLLIIYQLFLAYIKNTVTEGMDTQYQPYDTSNSSNVMILAQQNAGNIEVLKQQLDGLLELNKEVQDISGNLVNLQQQVYGLVQSQQSYAAQVTPSTPPDISGT